MALSEELKKIYTSNPTNNKFYDTISLSHPDFSKDFYFVLDTKIHKWLNKDNILVDFEPFGFTVVLPKKGDTQQNLQITMDNTNLILVKELNNAVQNINTPIKLTSAIYTDNEIDIQGNTYNLELKNISVTYNVITATATATDLINISFPKETFDNRFIGLYL